MKSLLLDLLKEDSKVSMMRLMSISSLLMGCFIAVYGILQGKDLDGVAKVCGVFVVAAFTGKAGQKAMEK